MEPPKGSEKSRKRERIKLAPTKDQKPALCMYVGSKTLSLISGHSMALKAQVKVNEVITVTETSKRAVKDVSKISLQLLMQ